MFDPRFVNIAVRIRRGNSLRRRHQRLVLDTAFARVIRKIVSVVSEEELDDAVDDPRKQVDLKFKVHVYSWGLFQPQTSHPIIRFLAKRGCLAGITSMTMVLIMHRKVASRRRVGTGRAYSGICPGSAATCTCRRTH